MKITLNDLILLRREWKRYEIKNKKKPLGIEKINQLIYQYDNEEEFDFVGFVRAIEREHEIYEKNTDKKMY